MAVFIALVLVGLSKCLKQIIQIELNRVKNPSWLEANQLAIYKHDQGFELLGPPSLRKHPFLLALRRRGRFARRNVFDSAAEIPY